MVFVFSDQYSLLFCSAASLCAPYRHCLSFGIGCAATDRHLVGAVFRVAWAPRLCILSVCSSNWRLRRLLGRWGRVRAATTGATTGAAAGWLAPAHGRELVSSAHACADLTVVAHRPAVGDGHVAWH